MLDNNLKIRSCKGVEIRGGSYKIRTKHGIFALTESMDTSKNTYNIVLPQGEAERPFFELNIEERSEIGRKVFQEVTRLAATVGALPVIASNMNKESLKKANQ